MIMIITELDIRIGKMMVCMPMISNKHLACSKFLSVSL